MEVTDYIEDFIDDNYEDVYNEYADVYPEEIHSDWTLEDAHDLDEFVLDHMSYEFNEYLRKKGYNKMITVDKQCRDILANQWLHNTNDGKNITKQYKNKKISRAEYLDYIYKQTEEWIAMLDSEHLKTFLIRQEYFDFNVDKQLKKLSEENKAAFIAEPMILKRIDSDGNHHFLLDAFKKPGDEEIKVLPLEPNKANELLERLEGLNLYCMGMNWTKKPGSPSILIFGVESYCKDLREQLVKTYGINR
jgi:hypothetical protein